VPPGAEGCHGAGSSDLGPAGAGPGINTYYTLYNMQAMLFMTKFSGSGLCRRSPTGCPWRRLWLHRFSWRYTLPVQMKRSSFPQNALVVFSVFLWYLQSKLSHNSQNLGVCKTPCVMDLNLKTLVGFENPPMQ
jgi:hypothetical protein